MSDPESSIGEPCRQQALPGLEPFPVGATPDPAIPRARTEPQALWLALHFPHLSLDLIARRENPVPLPLVICETRQGCRQVHAASRAARRAGIRPGMSLGAARGLCAALRVRPRDTAAEHAALTALAAWGMQYTDHVALEDDDVLLLELGRSLRLFGGLDTLRGRILEDLGQFGYQVRAGVAVTPLGARLLARYGTGEPACDPGTLATLTRDLPVEGLELPRSTTERLRAMGVSRIGALRRLPREGVTRRLGLLPLQRLDRLLGHLPDPRPRFEPPPRFEMLLWLPVEISDRSMLRHPLHRLLQKLAGVLRGRGAGIQDLALRLIHARIPATEISLALAAPGRDPDHCLALFMERLSRQTLAAEVTGLSVRADTLLPLPHRDERLACLSHRHSDADADSEAWTSLLDRLRVRLGRDAVFGLAVRDDHRPGRAWTRTDPADMDQPSAQPDGNAGIRPLWLLKQSLPCPRNLQRLHGPERIESGWWDSEGETRDYYVGEDHRGRRWWLFREHGKETSRLCGLFG